MYTSIRWQQRFQNFEKAFILLRDILAEKKELSQIEKEGVIQRFEYTFELAWKTLSDYLKFQGLGVEENLPRIVIKQGFNANVIKNGAEWINMLTNRNAMSHQYDVSKFEEVIKDLRASHLDLLSDFYLLLKGKITNA